MIHALTQHALTLLFRPRDTLLRPLRPEERVHVSRAALLPAAQLGREPARDTRRRHGRHSNPLPRRRPIAQIPESQHRADRALRHYVQLAPGKTPLSVCVCLSLCGCAKEAPTDCLTALPGNRAQPAMCRCVARMSLGNPVSAVSV